MRDSPTNMTAHQPIIYYGTELPSRARARELKNISVVLQTYHPLCQLNRFADYFPHAQRYVYFNPTVVPRQFSTDPQLRAVTLEYDTKWNLQRLDLKHPAARHFVITQGKLALQTKSVHGLFIDDLDRWDSPSRRRYAYSVLRELASERIRSTSWFINRGFGFWKRLSGLAAVLLEEISPCLLDHLNPADLSWVTAVVLPALRHAHARGAEIHCLTYVPGEVGWIPQGNAASAVAALTGRPLLACRHLDRWPKMLDERTQISGNG